ncbi:MAG: WbqC family protein [Bacteroidales bacterium]|nr:WbqC family protein [Bacteroidales bacterium]
MDILSTAYFPPISYISLLKRGDVFLEAHENYQKQSWRNRCNILTANGIESLQVPVVHSGGSFRHPIGEILVDYSRDFLVRHQRALDSAYMSSAYYQYYRDELFAIMDRRPATLWEWNHSLLCFVLRQLGIAPPPLTQEFTGANLDIHPKHADIYFKEKPYFQVFSQKYGFVPNLSILDLLFNEGPAAIDYL